MYLYDWGDIMLKEIPPFERPREKALKYGIDSLSTVELLAIILRTGSKDENVLDTSKKILYSIDNLARLREMTINELTKIKGIGTTKAITILASIELGIRILESKNEKNIFDTPKAVYEYFYPKLRLLNQEHLYAIFLNLKGKTIDIKMITKGTISSSLLDGKNIIKWALKLSATAIILVHNHPSGDPTPSISDLKTTSSFANQAKLLEIVVIDHIIVGDYFYSMKENTKLFKVF